MESVRRKKVYIWGRDHVGWSIDQDRKHIEQAARDNEIPLVENLIDADIIYSVWWNQLDHWKVRLIRKLFKNKKVIATLTNDPSSQKESFEKIRPLVDLWVYANTSQKVFLLEQGISSIKTYYSPFYVEETMFNRKKMTQKELCQSLDINLEDIKNKVLLGTFQRDSLTKDLLKPKWQKNPDLIVEILKKLDKEKFLLILAGPRRHYLVHRLEEEHIPFIYVGDFSMIQQKKDDVTINNLSSEKINLLYNLTDFYLVTSKSEGGPKAVIEAPLSKTLVLSTNVGMSKDLLPPEAICTTADDFAGKVSQLSTDDLKYKNILKREYDLVSEINNYEAFKKRVREIVSIV